MNQVKVVLITGAARRIGAAITTYLHLHGYNIIIHYNNSSEEADSLSSSLNHLRKDSAYIIQADLTSNQQINSLVEKSYAVWGRLDGLINNASVFFSTNFEDFKMSEWDSLFDCNAKAPFLLSLASHQHLKKTNGSIINITDANCVKPVTGYELYTMSKSLLAYQSSILAHKFAPQVRVNNIAPGAICWPEGINQLNQDIKQKIIDKTALKSHGSPQDIARAVHFLLQSNFITGETITVDGGRHL